jgi:hypothetical protein
MHLGKLPAISRQLLFVPILSMMVLAGACRTSPPSEIKTDPSGPAKTESNSKVAEQPAERPLFSGRIENVSMYPVPNKREDLAISLVVSITNAGSSSVAQGWNLEVSSPRRQVPASLEPVHVNGLVEMPGSAGKKVDLGKEDLVLKTSQAAIAKSNSVNGILTFVLPKSTQSELANNSTRLVLHFKDFQGHSYPTPAVVVGAKAGLGK